jgi:hypothetical protein
MRSLADMAGMPDVRSRRVFFDRDIVRQIQPLEVELQFVRNFHLFEMRPVCTSIFRMRFGSIFSLEFLSSSSVAAFRGPNSDTRNGVCFATSRQASKNIAPEALHSHAVFLNLRPNPSSEGERCMKHTVHRVVHFSVHRRIFGKVRTRRSCATRADQFGRGQNTGLGWSVPTFVHGCVPKVIRGVAPAQLRGDRAECFVHAAFCNRGPQR